MARVKQVARSTRKRATQSASTRQSRTAAGTRGRGRGSRRGRIQKGTAGDQPVEDDALEPIGDEDAQNVADELSDDFETAVKVEEEAAEEPTSLNALIARHGGWSQQQNSEARRRSRQSNAPSPPAAFSHGPLPQPQVGSVQNRNWRHGDPPFVPPSPQHREVPTRGPTAGVDDNTVTPAGQQALHNPLQLPTGMDMDTFVRLYLTWTYRKYGFGSNEHRAAHNLGQRLLAWQIFSEDRLDVGPLQQGHLYLFIYILGQRGPMRWNWEECNAWLRARVGVMDAIQVFCDIWNGRVFFVGQGV